MSKWKIQNGMLVEQFGPIPKGILPKEREELNYFRDAASRNCYSCSPELLALYPEGSEVPESAFQVVDDGLDFTETPAIQKKVAILFDAGQLLEFGTLYHRAAVQPFQEFVDYCAKTFTITRKEKKDER